MRGVTAINVDAGLFRKVNITERISAQFRVEAAPFPAATSEPNGSSSWL